MGDLGMLGGIGQGLQAAVSTYLQTKNMIQENEIKKRLANAQTVDASTKLMQAGGRRAANAMAGTLGLPEIPSANEEPTGLIETPEGQGQGILKVPAGGQSSATPQDPRQAYLKESDNNYDQPEGTRKTLQEVTDAKYRLAANPQTKQGMQDELFKEYQSQKPVQDVHAAQTPLRKLLAVDPKSPTAVDTALIALMGIEKPNQVATEGNLHELSKSGGYSQNVVDLINRKLHGTLTPESFNDIQRTGIGSYKQLSDAARSAQSDFAKRAQSRGVDSKYITMDSNLDNTDNLVAKKLKKIGTEYKSTLGNMAQSSPEAKGLVNAASSGASGFLNAAKGLVNNLVPNTATAETNSPPTALKPHPQDGMALQWAKKNPKDPRAVQILKMNGVQ